MEVYFLEKYNKLNHSRRKPCKNWVDQRIPCLCRTCKHIMVFSDTTTIRYHVLVGGSVENYMIWIFHGEKAHPPSKNPLNEIIEESSLIDCLMLIMILLRVTTMMIVLVDAMMMVSTRGYRWW